MHAKSLGAAALWLAAAALPAPANASLTTDLQSLATQLSGFHTQLAALDLSGSGDCVTLGTLNTSLEDYTAGIDAVIAQLADPLSLTGTDLASLDDLSTLARNMSEQAVRLSRQLATVEGVYELVEYRTALSAMLRLSDDIGTMANRILEMADRILVMADNIGLMADRILITQQLQNSNVALTQAAVLTTQQNMVALSDSLSTVAYNLSLGQLKLDTQALADLMGATTLSETDMAGQLGALELSTTAVLTRAVALYTASVLNSQGASHYIDGDTLTLLGDLSNLHKALALSLDTYAQAIERLSPVTDTPILADATASMLRLTRDVGVMSDRIVEMGDRIIVMADNIGLMAGRIVETQNLQQTNIELTQSSVVSAQAAMLTVIRNFGL